MRCSIAAVMLLLSASVALSQETKLPAGLKHVPPDSLGFIHVRVTDFLKSEIGKQLMLELLGDKEAQRGLEEAERELGLKLADVETVTVLMLPMPSMQQLRYFDGPMRRFGPFGPGYKYKTEPKAMPVPIFEDKKPAFEEKEKEKAAAKESPVLFQGPFTPQDLPDEFPLESMEYLGMTGPLVIVTTTRDIDRKGLLRSQVFGQGGRDPHERRGRDWSLQILGDRAVMMGMPWELARHSELIARNPGPKQQPLTSAFALASKPHVLVAGGKLPAPLGRMIFGPFNPEARVFAALAPLLQTDAALALDLGKNLEVTLQFDAPNKAGAENALQAVKTLRALGELLLEKSNEQGEPGGWKLVLEKRLKQALADAVIEQEGLRVKARVRMELDAVLVKRYTKEIVVGMRSKADRTQSVNNLKQIGLALHSFHDANKRLPGAGVSGMNGGIDPNGKPLLSWRVAILPYIDEGPLYQKFDLSQPWDHPTNKKLIPLMPKVYMVPGAPDSKEPGMTHYRVFVGPQTAFEPGQRISLVSFTDGTSNTFMVVEAAEPTTWTKPDDLPFDPKTPLAKLGVTGDGFNVVFGDGSVRFIRAGTPEATLRAFITRNGGEVVELPDSR